MLKKFSLTLLFSIFFGFIIIILGASYFIYSIEKDLILNELKKTEVSKLEVQVNEITHDLEFIQRDVLLLRDLVSMVEDYSCQTGKSFKILEEEFLYFISRKKFYDQLRFLDSKGQEKLRINVSGGNPKILAQEFLQNKANRYYFKEIKNLSLSDIYISKFDLNVEGDSIEIPHKPIIRVSTQVSNCNDEFIGVVVLNYLGEDLIYRIKELNTNTLSHIYLLDPNGYYLISPYRDKNWGFIFENRKDIVFENDFQKSWKSINDNLKGQFITEKGLFTYNTLGFNLVADANRENNLGLYSTDGYWKIVSHVTNDEINALNYNILSRFYLPVIFLIILSFFTSLIIVRIRINNKKSKIGIIEKNTFLINIINSLSQPFYVICPESGTVQLANLSAIRHNIIEQENFKINTLGLSDTNYVELKNARNAVKLNKEPDSIELEIKSKKNISKFFNVEIEPIISNNGEVNSIIEIINDISAEKLSELKFKGLLSSAPDGMIITNNKSIIEMVNGQAEVIFGYKAEELIGKPIEILIPGRFSNHENLKNSYINNPHRRLMGEGRELLGLKKSGEEFPVEISLSPIETEEGLLISAGIRDITKRKLIEEKIKESEAKFKALFDNQSQFIGLLETDGTLIEANKTALQFGGFKIEDIKGKKFWEAPWWSSSKQAVIDLKDAIKRTAQGEYIRYEVEVLGEGNKMITIDFSLQPVRNEDGEVIFIIPEGKDVSERRKYLLELERRELLLNESQRISRLGSWSWDIKDDKIIWSSELYRIFGLDENEFQADFNTYAEFIPEDDRFVLQNKIQASLKSKEGYSIEHKIILKDGTVKFIEGLANVELDENGEVAAFYGTAMDITERKNVEDEFQKLALVARETDNIVIITDEKGEIEWVNLTFEKSTGFTFDEVVGKKPGTFLQGEKTSSKTIKEISKAVKNRKPIKREILNYTKSGEEYWVILNIQPIAETSKTKARYIGVASDITQLKNKENEILELNNELEHRVKERTIKLETALKEVEHANNAKSDFLANMSHEIRTPMNSIIGFSNLLGKLVSEDVQKNYLESIKVSSRNLLKLINDILDLSKIEAGKLEIQNEFMDVHSLIKEIPTLFEYQIKEKELDFVIDISENVPQIIDIDELRLRQILLNLVGNAVKFTEEGFVKLNIDAHLNDQKSICNLNILVSDSGIGINKNDLDKIFESFTQSEKQLTKKFGGTGLGLSITKKLVDLMEGEISVKSNIGEGTQFEIILKDIQFTTDEIRAEEIPKIDYDLIRFDKPHVLVVDDNDENRRFLSITLSDLNIKVEEAINGKDALNKIGRNTPDLIITDIQMPLMNGFELLQKIKSNNKTLHIPVIAATASVMKDNIRMLLSSDFASYVEKPIITELLVNELIKYLPYNLDDIVMDQNFTVRDFSGISKENYNKIIDDLALLKQMHKPLLEQQAISDVEAFANKSMEISKKYDLISLKNFSEQLLSALDTFDIEVIMNKINKFTKLTDIIKEELNKNQT